MKSVLTVITPSDKEKLTKSFLQEIGDNITKSGGKIIGSNWLAQDYAFDITYTRLENEIAEAQARKVIADAPIDCIAQDVAERQKRLLICDMDSTIITVECIDEIADFMGLKAKVAAITERAMRGEIDFASALKERVALLKGLKESVLQEVYNTRIKFTPGARELVATMREQGAYAALVSGGFDFFTSRIQAELGFDSNSANRLEIKDGVLTGEVLLPILDRKAKLDTLIDISSKRDISLIETLAVGDGANDLPMLTAAGIGAAYHAKPVVQENARVKINHCDLTSLLYMQGYKQEEFVK